MSRYRNLSLVVCLVIVASVFSPAAYSQSDAGAQQPRATAAAPTVTASATSECLRVTSPEQAALRLEIYSESGERFFDSDFRAGSVLDFRTGDANRALAAGAHLFVVTTRDLQGRLRQRLGTLTVDGRRLSLSEADEEKLNPSQARALADARKSQGISLTGLAPSVAVLDGVETQAVTLATHDGREGQLTSAAGALTLRTGDVLKGEDIERVRVTEDGKVGIGTDRPEAALDVAGEIRARRGIRFEDGTLLTSAAGGGVTGDGSQNIAGTGTAGRLPKWVDGAGTLGDSVLTESNGNIGIGTQSPATKLDMVGSMTFRNSAASGGFRLGDRATDQGRQLVFGSAPGTPYSVFNTFVQGSTLNSPRLSQFSVWTSDIDVDSTNAEQFLFGNYPAFGGLVATVRYGAGVAKNITFQANWNGSTTPNAFVLATNNNVGVGTTTPTHKLEVVGSLKLSGAGSALVFPDGTSMTTAAAGGVSTPSGTNIVSAINDPTTAGVIGDNRLAPNVARMNGANNWTGANVFGAGLSANNALVTNVGSPVNAGDAVNKAYADANFVKFVPGAEQLSVGDANGTAPMINLRGGSTCCSGPGGHTPAFFKVFQNGSFVATGNLGIGTSPMEGKGYRTSWHTYKGAFRSGYADNEWDDANVGFFSWAGGSNSTASGLYALAFGDTNFARSTSSIAFGSGNEVKGAAGFSAGAGNRVCDTYGVALGNNARSGGPYIDGKCDPETFNIRGLAAVAIGYNVTADQDHTTAMGKFASNNGFQGTFIWSDGAPQASADTFRNTANNEFAARATGGFRFRTNLGGTTGCNLPAGSGVFNCTSSRATKENFAAVSGDDVLARLRKVPVSTWNYISEGRQVRHLGPMAEDFFTAFNLGTNNVSIGVQDLAGVSLAAVKALDERTGELQSKTEELRRKTAEVEQLRAQVQTLEQRLSALEEAVRAKDQK